MAGRKPDQNNWNGWVEPEGRVIGRNQDWCQHHASYDSDDCLIWPYGRCKKSGYPTGTTKLKAAPMKAHQYMCELANGPRTVTHFIAAHTCGNGHKGCVNPKHLYWATPVQNAVDMVGHGTSRLGAKW